MGDIFAAMTKVDIPPTLKMSEGRELANEQLMTAIPVKETRDFVLMNLVKESNGRYVERIFNFVNNGIDHFVLCQLHIDLGGEPMWMRYIKILTITFRNFLIVSPESSIRVRCYFWLAQSLIT